MGICAYCFENEDHTEKTRGCRKKNKNTTR